MAPIRPILRDAGVTEQQRRVPRVIDDAGSIDPTALAEQAILFAPSVTRILKELIERGLIVRTQDPEDGSGPSCRPRIQVASCWMKHRARPSIISTATPRPSAYPGSPRSSVSLAL